MTYLRYYQNTDVEIQSPMENELEIPSDVIIESIKRIKAEKLTSIHCYFTTNYPCAFLAAR